MAKTNQLWFKGKKTHTVLFTEEDLRTVMVALDKLFDVVKTRIYFQLGCGGNGN